MSAELNAAQEYWQKKKIRNRSAEGRDGVWSPGKAGIKKKSTDMKQILK